MFPPRSGHSPSSGCCSGGVVPGQHSFTDCLFVLHKIWSFERKHILQNNSCSPHIREREICNRKAAPENQTWTFSFPAFADSYFRFLLCKHPWRVLPVWVWLSAAAAEATLEREWNWQMGMRGRGDDEGRSLFFPNPTCRWLRPWLATESFLNSWIKIFTPLTTLSCAPSLGREYVSFNFKCFLYNL